VSGFLLDTNVVSELVRRHPDRGVVAWTAQQDAAELHLSAITLGELIRGVERLAADDRRARLERWLRDELPRQFRGRILPFDRAAAEIWGRMMGEADRLGRPRPAIDAQIAAIAHRHDLTMVTRNTADFEQLGLPLVNPWS
jgi:toxin FitB